jgi:hypothetical protein
MHNPRLRKYLYPLTILLSVSSLGVAEPDGSLSKLRLSGVILVGGEPKLAVVEQRDGGGRTVRPGDKLRGVGVVTAIGPDWVSIDVGGEERVLHLTSTAQGQPPGNENAPTTDDQDISPPGSGSVDVTPELLEELGRVAANPSANDEDLSLTLIPLLGLSGDARVKLFFPGEPEREGKGPAEVHAALVRGQAVRLRIEEGGEDAMIYLMPAQMQSQQPPAAIDE